MLELEMYEVYCGHIELGLDKLRAQCLGQLKPIKAIVPIADWIPAELTAELAAEILTILIYKVDRLDDGTLWFYQSWLEAVIGFILENCPVEDHTLWSVVKIAKLENDIVLELFSEDLPQDTRYALLHPPEGLADLLEEAIWVLMEDREKKQYLQDTAKWFQEPLF